VKDIKGKIARIADLEQQLKESEERQVRLEATMPTGELDIKLKFINQEKNVEQLTLMYHQLSSQKKMTDMEKKILESKLNRKNESLKNMTGQLQTANQQVVDLRQGIKEISQILQEIVLQHPEIEKSGALRSKAENIEKALGLANTRTGQGSLGRAHHPHHKVVKSIRGGGGRQKGPLASRYWG